MLFFWVYQQIVECRVGKRSDRITIFIDILLKHLPVAPLHTEEFVVDVNDDGFSSGFLRLPHQKIGLVAPFGADVRAILARFIGG
jgi:hypothetical protein